MAKGNEMNRTVLALIVVIALVAVIAVFLFRGAEEPPPAVVAPQVEESPAPVVEPVADVEPPPPAPSVPAEPEVPPDPLPPLEESDPDIVEALSTELGAGFTREYLVPDSILRKSVVTLDNLPADRVAMKVRAIRRVDGRFLVTGTEEAVRPEDPVFLDPENYARYTDFVRYVERIDPAQAVDLYARWYPRLQELYEELGYPDRQFNDRAIEVIDQLLATPEVAGPIALVRPNVLYEFADPDLEALTGGQKALLRMGPDNARIVKDKLRAIRKQLVERSVALE
jgi:hypothetical protein